MSDQQTLDMHKSAVEGGIFYRNELAAPQNVRTYFPHGVDQPTYSKDPHISHPVTSDTINRIVSLLCTGMSTVAPQQTELDDLLDRNSWHEKSRQYATRAMVAGNHLVLLRPGLNGVQFDEWGGEFAFGYSFPFEYYGYEYLLEKDGSMSPVLFAPQGKDLQRYRSFAVDDTYYYITSGTVTKMAPHGYGFCPAVMFRAVDRDNDNRYGIPYHKRFKDDLLEYNQVYSQCSKDILILQAVWATNTDRPSPEFQISFNNGNVNYLGQDGKLWQVKSELDLAPKLEYLDRIKLHISTSAQVPDFMTGLQDVGKVESGVALNIVSGPLLELMGVLRFGYKRDCTKLLQRAMMADSATHGRRIAEPKIELNMNEKVLPDDVDKFMQHVDIAVRNQILTPQECREAVAKMLGIQLPEMATV